MKISIRKEILLFHGYNNHHAVFSRCVFAQQVGDNVFLQGAYVEVGIAPNGGYGSTRQPPEGYHENSGRRKF